MFADCQYIAITTYVLGVQLLVRPHVTGDGAPKKVPDPFSLHALYAILVWHYYSPGPADFVDMMQISDSDRPQMYQDVVVQVSNDPAFKKDVKTVFNNDHDNSSGLGKGKDDTYVETSEGRWINPKGVKGRYVRLYSRGCICLFDGKPAGGAWSELNHYIEVEVYGK